MDLPAIRGSAVEWPVRPIAVVNSRGSRWPRCRTLPKVRFGHARRRKQTLKGYQPDHLVGLDEVKRWVEEKVPGTYQVLRAQERFAAPTAVHFEFWTSGEFTAEAIAFLNAAKAMTKRYGIHYRGGADVRKFVAAVNAPGLVKTLDEHYFNHPLARTNAEYDASAALDAVELSLELELGGGVDDDDDEGVPYLALTSPSPALTTPTTTGGVAGAPVSRRRGRPRP